MFPTRLVWTMLHTTMIFVSNVIWLLHVIHLCNLAFSDINVFYTISQKIFLPIQ